MQGDWEGFVEDYNKDKNNQNVNKGNSSTKRGKRGMGLEKMLIRSNEQYKRQGIALVNKMPKPIVVQNYNSNTKKITKAYYEKKALVDFLGTYKGQTIGFEAKETAIKTRFDLSNLKEHQFIFLQNLIQNGGLAFIIISFTSLEEIYLVPFSLIKKYWDNMLNGRKSIPYSKIKEKSFEIKPKGLIDLDYIAKIKEWRVEKHK